MLDFRLLARKGAEYQHCHFQKFSCSVFSPTEEVITCQGLFNRKEYFCEALFNFLFHIKH